MSAYDTVDWRRRVFALYSDVRATAEPAAAHDLWRRGRDELFASHPATPLREPDRASFRGLPVPAYDPAWRFEVEVRDAAPERVELDTGTDGAVPFERLGVVDLPGVGSLDVWRLASYGGGLFVPVKDASAGRPGGTYGGGRYLVDTVKGADLGSAGGTLVLDLNFAYNPSCAYDPDWACPLAQPGNTVPAEIPVGERTYP
ncbi:DUF1684 domain-containing protein [Nocardioides panacis]|uniref:DUF1684 domain-containing protein n=1 Tax=Nocardioides panacis TaxID=2849501 RepID=A0A975T1S0_9ACTN|nr:DUF1684 domain-containing protein [Nocardioides panacis]QWZ09294.1 DUF1684 domain-containing protein [Nocardioides panacis]